MCGFIAGNTEKSLEQYIETISYRGLPGFKGFGKYGKYQFAHYALPFVNLDPNIATQPVYNENIPFVFAGEIFNFSELAEGYNSDTKYLCDEFFKNGFFNFHKFDGFWSFATLLNGKLLAVTDYLCQKPVYYRTDMELVASEIEILRSVGETTPNKKFLSNVLKWGYNPGPETPWNEIKQIPPGHFYYDGGIYCYWDWNKVKTTTLKQDLTNAVINRMGGQREVAILLSGGLDSSIIYSLLKQNGIKPKAIHVNNHEEEFAYLLTDDIISVNLDGVNRLTCLLDHQSPVDLGSTAPQIAMAKKLKELGFHAVMTGDGADELFGGYNRAKSYDSQYSDIFEELPYYHCPKLDRTMMKQTIELRAPFLSAPVVKHALDTPYNMRNGVKGALIKEFSSDVPAAILTRSKHPLKTDSIRDDPLNERLKNNSLWCELFNINF